MRKYLFSGMLVAIVGLLAACEVDDGGTATKPDPNEGKNYSQPVAAAEGGVLSTDGGTADVTIPAGALAEDTTITVKVESATAGAQSSVYDFGPNGTQFLTPVTVSIAFSGSAGSERKAVLAWQDDDKWVEVAGSKVTDGRVTGSINHFTKFTIIFVDDKAVLVGECADVARSFQACGGDLNGHWEFDAICFEDTTLGGNPFEDTCPDATIEFEMNWDGYIEFDGTNATQQFRGQVTDIVYTIPTSCLPTGADCATIFEDDANCSTKGGACVCKSTESSEAGEPSVNPYQIIGNTLKIGDNDPVPYCVQGDKVTVEITDIDDETGDVSKMYTVLKKM